jgi:hypothetical protein
MNVIVVVTALGLWSAGSPELLRGIDTVPDGAAVAAVPVGDLVAVVVDGGARPVLRARAARLLGARDVDVVAVDVALRGVVVDVGAPGALRAQATLALAERAARRHDLAAVVAIADAALADADPAVVRAGVLSWWWLGGDVARRRLEALSARPDAVGGAARGRLREWERAGGWRRLDGDGVAGGVLDPRHGGPPPAR